MGFSVKGLMGGRTFESGCRASGIGGNDCSGEHRAVALPAAVGRGVVIATDEARETMR
jgi:hypothetical protein